MQDKKKIKKIAAVCYPRKFQSFGNRSILKSSLPISDVLPMAQEPSLHKGMHVLGWFLAFSALM